MSQIGTAKQVGTNVEVYDENGYFKFSHTGQLVGYTSTSVSIKINSNTIYVYDENGNFKFNQSC